MQAFDIITDNDEPYLQYLGRLSAEFQDVFTRGNLFTTDASGLWEIYLSQFPENRRQYHNCNTCRRFIEQFGGLVTINQDGGVTSALWHIENDEHLESIRALRSTVERAAVTGVFVTDASVLGQYESGRRIKGNPASTLWNHLSVAVTAARRHTRRDITAHQAACEKLEDANNVERALSEFSAEILGQAVALLEGDALYRSEKVLGPAKWLFELQTKAQQTKNNRTKRNLIFRAVADAPAGFCHPRSSMIGTLLDDISAGNGFEWAANRFRSKMHPLQYQRPQADPSTGAIEAAEKLVEKLGIARSLERRFARLEEIKTVWAAKTPSQPEPVGVFGHLKQAASKAPSMTVPGGKITWVKFASTVLPTAGKVEVNAPYMGSYCAYLTATNLDAPPILQWDNETERNQFSLYLYHNGSSASNWGISTGWHPVAAISLRPEQWNGEFSYHAKGALFVIPGCADSRDDGLCLFPETLNSELHGCRSVIEAHSHKTKRTGKESASACGLLLGANSSVEVRVTGSTGIVTTYQIDRWD